MSRIESIRKLLASAPDDTFLLYSLGMELLAAGRAAEAIEQFGRVLQLDPEYLAAHSQMAQAMHGSGDHAGAAEVLARGIEVAEQQGDGHAADRLRLLLKGIGGAD